MTQLTTAPTEQAGLEPSRPPEPSPSRRVVVNMPVDVRSFSLGLLALLASIYTLHRASAVFIPIMVGILSSYALSPVVDWFHARRVPRAASPASCFITACSARRASSFR